MEALCLPCGSCSDKKCKKSGKTTYACKRIDKELGTGIAWPKKRTYSVDLRHIEGSSNLLNKFQRNVLAAIEKSSQEIKHLIYEKQDLKEAMSNLSKKEQLVIKQLFFEGYKQKEVAKNLGISQPRVNRLKKRALKRLKNFNCMNEVIKDHESL